MRARKSTHAVSLHAAGKAGVGGYGTREVAELIGLAPERIRRFVQRGLLAPAREDSGQYRFSFQDMVLLRTLKGLLDADVSPRRALSALAKLRDRLAERRDKQSLSAMRVFADGSTVLVQDEDVLWDAETGQGQLFAFTVEQLAGEVRTLARRNLAAAEEADDLDSDDWYNLGLDLEEVEPAKAPEAYRRSLALNPDNADAHVNLGRLFQIRGDLKHAQEHYRQALDVAPAHPLALYNLGTVFDELEQLDIAIDYYQRAQGIPDAQYNLASIFRTRGDELASRRHMRQYRQMTRKEQN